MLLRALILVLFLPVAALGQGMPAPVSDAVNDFADLLPPEAEARLAAALRAARAETGVQTVVVTLDRLAAHGGEDQRLQDYAKALFNLWGVGDTERNDGILILVVRDDRAMRIALGAAYDSVWDNMAQRVINRSFLPAFRDGLYAEGIEHGVTDTVDVIARPFAAGHPAPPAPARGWSDRLPFVAFCLFVIAVLVMALGERLAGRVVRLKPCPTCQSRSLHRSRDVVEAATSAAAGRGVIHTRCSTCGWNRDEPYTIASRRSGTSSGSGGGRSSGGGASGRW